MWVRRQTSQRCIGYLFNPATCRVDYRDYRGTKPRFAPVLTHNDSPGCIWVSENEDSETVWKILSTSQPSYHEPRHRYIDERFSGGAQPLVVLAHPTVLREPREGSLHNPAAWESRYPVVGVIHPVFQG